MCACRRPTQVPRVPREEDGNGDKAGGRPPLFGGVPRTEGARSHDGAVCQSAPNVTVVGCAVPSGHAFLPSRLDGKSVSTVSHSPPPPSFSSPRILLRPAEANSHEMLQSAACTTPGALPLPAPRRCPAPRLPRSIPSTCTVVQPTHIQTPVTRRGRSTTCSMEG